jgi:hypothetical protein
MLHSSIDSQIGIINNLFSHHGLEPDVYILQRFKLGGVAGVLRYVWLLCLSRSPFSSHFITCFVIHIIITPGMYPRSNYLLIVLKKCLSMSNKTLPHDMVRLYILLCFRLAATTCA